MACSFGTDGIRGVANTELTPELSFRIGRFLAYIINRQELPTKIVVGRDTRLSGELLEAALIAGILSMGVDVVKAGVIPTPAVAFLTCELNAAAGVMISASHNPFLDNGIKILDADGYKFSVENEQIMEEFLKKEIDDLPRISGKNLGRILTEDDVSDLYLNYLKSKVTTDFCGLHIVLDCAHGAAYRIAPLILRDLGADVTALNVSPNGININEHCGSTSPGQLRSEVLRQKADLGISFDGDADRVIAVDEQGNVIDGDQLIYIFAKSLQRSGLLKQDTVVTTVMSNLGLIQALKQLGISCRQTPVGDRYVVEELLRGGYSFGGEQSGHIVFIEHSSTGDGLLTALQLLSVIRETGEPLSKLAAPMVKKPQYLTNVSVIDTDDWQENEPLLNIVREIEQNLGDSGRVLIRPSGTEPLFRIMVEGDNEEQIAIYGQNIADVVKKEFN